jgi:hypothetical protein
MGQNNNSVKGLSNSVAGLTNLATSANAAFAGALNLFHKATKKADALSAKDTTETVYDSTEYYNGGTARHSALYMWLTWESFRKADNDITHSPK